MSRRERAASKADPGMVIIQVKKICLPIPQRTDPRRWADPAPKIEEETIWVVLTGNPNREERYMIAEEQAWALNPWTGLTL